ncbi:hypothetical protein ACWGE0_02965 [Lentzea sp. NPDC054927]
MLKTRTTLTAILMATAAVVAMAPSASAAVTRTIEADDIKYGASYMTGTVTFYNRSVNVSGPAHFVGCRTIYAIAYDIQEGGGLKRIDIGSSSPQCDKDHLINIPLSADTGGGADMVMLEMRDGNGKALGPFEEYHR